MARVATRRALVSRPAGASGPWWEVAGQTCVIAYQPKGAALLAASYINLANPGTYNAAEGTAPTFATATGWTFDGSTQYLAVAYTPTANTSVIVRFSSIAVTTYPCLFGEIHTIAANGFYITPSGTSGDANQYYIHGPTATGNTRVVAAGNISTDVMAIAGQAKAYRAGAPVGTFTANPYTACSYGIAIGARMDNGGAAEYFIDGSIQAIAFYSTVLTDADVAILTTRMNAL